VYNRRARPNGAHAITWSIGGVVQMAGASTASEIDLETLYRTERVGLLRLAMLLTQDRSVAEDIVHDAFTKGS